MMEVVILKRKEQGPNITRRKFIKMACATGIGLSALGLGACSSQDPKPGSRQSAVSPDTSVPGQAGEQAGQTASAAAKVYLVLTSDRKDGVRRLLELLGPLEYAGKKILLKPNFNTADPAPGSTHNETLEQLLVSLQAAAPASLTVGERSGPPLTANVVRDKGVLSVCQNLGVGLINYDELPAHDWLPFRREGLHWQDGFLIPRPVAEADINVATCLLKTHAYGGVFSMSLKLAVGLVPRRGYAYMTELHNSPDMRKMIAEINLAYQPDFVLMDGVDVFVDGGPDRGTRKNGNVMLLSRDRVALDAVGVAILKELGSNRAIMDTPVFEQEQIKRAAELGLGSSGPEQIEIISDNTAGEQYAGRLQVLLTG